MSGRSWQSKQDTLSRFLPGSVQRPIIRYTDPSVRVARQAGRSYWQVRYRDGTIINEWDAGADWPLLKRQGLVEGRLVCPNGDVAVLGNSIEVSDRLFQFKIGVVQVSTGSGLQSGRLSIAQVMGIITKPDGTCTLYAWEYPGRMVGPIQDTYPNLRYGGPVTQGMSDDVLGVKA